MKSAMLPRLCLYVDTLQRISTCTDSLSASRQPFFRAFDAFYRAPSDDRTLLGVHVFTSNVFDTHKHEMIRLYAYQRKA